MEKLIGCYLTRAEERESSWLKTGGWKTVSNTNDDCSNVVIVGRNFIFFLSNKVEIHD